jgi:hypothetical protein
LKFYCSVFPSAPGKKRLIRWGVVTDQQYALAESELLGRLQTMREKKSGSRVVIPKESTSREDSIDMLDYQYHQPISSKHQAALNEWIQYQQLVKAGKYFPKK